MLLLLDENLPKKLKKDFPEHKVFTIKERGWNGLKNGVLLQKLLENKFDAWFFGELFERAPDFDRLPARQIGLSRCQF